MLPEPKTSPAQSRESRLALKSAAPFLVTIIAGVICYGLFVNRGLGLPILGYNVSPAERVLQGEAPYRDFIYNYTPGVLWLNALLMKWFGASLMTINWGLFVFKLGALAALFYIARRFASGWIALLPVALTLAWIGYRVIFRVYPTQYSMLFVLLGIIFMLAYDRTKRQRWLLACGLAVGFVFLFKHNVGVYLLGASTIALAVRETLVGAEDFSWRAQLLNLLKKSAVFWSGFAVVAAGVGVYLASAGALFPMLEHFFSVAGEYSELRSIALPDVRLIAPVVASLVVVTAIALFAIRRMPRLFEPFLTAVMLAGSIILLLPGRAYLIKNSATAAISYFPIALFALTLIFLAWQFVRHRRSRQEREWLWQSYGPIIIVAAFALAAYLEMFPRADYAHLVRVLPPVFLLLFLLMVRCAAALVGFFQDRLPRPRRAALLCAAVPIVFLFATGIKDGWQPRFDSSFRLIEQTPLAIKRASGILVTRKQAEFVDSLAVMIETNSSPDDYIFSFAPRGTAFYFLSARKNPTRLVWWRSVAISNADREAFLRQIGERVPELILIPDGFHNERVRAQIESGYERIGAVADIAVYKRNLLPLATSSGGR